jgi:hypothetical protein
MDGADRADRGGWNRRCTSIRGSQNGQNVRMCCKWQNASEVAECIRDAWRLIEQMEVDGAEGAQVSEVVRMVRTC